jgi:phospholipid/cholesterol/gamma-HCH transport system permease protein
MLSYFETFGRFLSMMAWVLWSTLRHPPRLSLIRDRLYDLGVLSLPVIAITGLSTGMVLAAQAYFQLSDKGLTGTTGIMVAKSMLVELGPILTAFMITGRVGASIAAELGTMKVSEQIDALNSMAIDPHAYLIAPRCIAMTIITPILTIFSSAIGIFGGYLVAVQLYGMAPQDFFNPLPVYVNWFDVTTGVVKSVVFGILIVSISCFQGMMTSGGAAGVGKSTTQAVVSCYAAILLANFMLTLALNAFYWIIFQV